MSERAALLLLDEAMERYGITRDDVTPLVAMKLSVVLDDTGIEMGPLVYGVHPPFVALNQDSVLETTDWRGQAPDKVRCTDETCPDISYPVGCDGWHRVKARG